MPHPQMDGRDKSLRLKKANGKVEIYDLHCFHVVKRDEMGRPSELRVIYGHETIDVNDGMEFITGWMPRELMSEPKNPRL